MNSRDEMKAAMDQRRANGFPQQADVYGDPGLQGLKRRQTIPEDALVKRDDAWQIYGVTLDPLGLEIPNTLDPDTFEKLSTILFELEDQTQLWMGDLLVAAQRNQMYSEVIDQLIIRFNRDPETLNKYYRICNGVPKRLRRRELHISHYEKVYAMNEPDKADWINKAADNKWTVADLVEQIRGERPTLSYMDRFVSAFKTARNSYLRFARGVGREERRQMTSALRALADEIERLG